MSHRDTFNECGKIETLDSVSIVSGMAADNAVEMVDSRFDEKGEFADAFIDAWVLSVSSVLASAAEYLTKDEANEARAWFADRGIDY